MNRVNVVIILLVIGISSCMPIVEEEPTVSFWTDNELETAEVYSLYVNGIDQGSFEMSYDEVNCGDSMLIDVPILSDVDMVIKLRTNQGHNIEVGKLNLFDLSSGINVNSNYPGALFVEHKIEETCTRVRVRW